MFQEDKNLVYEIARQVAKEEIAKALKVPEPTPMAVDEPVADEDKDE
jgi:hypothetical protein